MEKGFYSVAKSFILYRQKRFELRTARVALVTATGDVSLEPTLASFKINHLEPEYSLTVLASKFIAISAGHNASINEQLKSPY